MALVEKNSPLASVHGSVGSLVIVHQNGRVWTRSKPRVTPKATPRRKAHRGKFGRASQWASQLPSEAPEVAAKYQELAKGTDRSWQNLAIADYMHGPVIEEIDLSGYTGRSNERIRVQARDDVPPPLKLGVAQVRVIIRNLEGRILEQGEAIPDGAAWAYVTRTEAPRGQILKIEVIAADQPGNHTAKTVPHLIPA